MLQKIRNVFHITGTERGEMQLREVKQLFIISTIGIVIILQIVFAWMFMREMGWVNGGNITAKYDRNVAVLTLDQEITNQYVNNIIGQLELIKKSKDKFQRLLVIVSSPGGSPVGSSELLAYLKTFQKSIPITVYVQDMAVSGSYYISVASQYNPSDKLSGIIASENALVGSIGVIMPHLVIGGAADKIGISEDDIFVGRYKKPISLFKRTSDADKLYLSNNLLNPVYRHFIQAVATGRHMEPKEVEKFADGQIFVSTEVLGKLVDRISNIGEIKDEIETNVKKDYPNDEVGFVEIDMSGRQKGMFNVKISLDGLGIGANIKEEAQHAPISMQ